MAVNIMALMDAGRQAGQEGRAQGQQSYLSRLASQAYGAAPDQQGGIVQQAIATNADAGFNLAGSLGKKREYDFSKLGQAAALMGSMPDEQKAQFYTSNVAPLAHELGFQVPTSYDPRFQPMIDKLVQMHGATGQTADAQNFTNMTQGFTPEQVQQARMVQAGLQPRAGLPSIYDGGAAGVFGVDRAGYNARPISLGGAQQQAPQQPQMSQVQYATSDGSAIPPEEQAIAAQAMAASARGEDVNIPVGGSAPAQGGALPPPLDYQNGGQLRAAPKPAAQAEESFSQPQQVVGPDGKPRLVQFGNRGGMREVSGYSDAPKELSPAAAATAEVKKEKAAAAKADTIDTMDQSISAIDAVLKHPGFNWLGTYQGDIAGAIPHTETADAKAALDVVKNQVLLNTIAKLKALSATGASGFGALSNQEGEILKNSVASLTNAQSNGAIRKSLLDIQAALKRSRDRVAGQEVAFPAAPAPGSAPAGGVDDLLGKYGIR